MMSKKMNAKGTTIPSLDVLQASTVLCLVGYWCSVSGGSEMSIPIVITISIEINTDVMISWAAADMNLGFFVGNLFFEPASIRAIRFVLTSKEA
jgi:hypothetical protein